MILLEQRSSDAHQVPSWLAHHPTIVRSVISIEAWERFSFYGMQALLGYYLYYQVQEGGLGMERGQATALIGAYGALVYLCTFFGGFIGDRILGPEQTLLSGATLLVLGHLSMAVDAHSTWQIISLTVGLLCIALGSGMLKTAAITMLAIVYQRREHYRETGFQLFYFGIQIAAIVGPILCGWLAQHYGFHAGFSAAAVLMVLGVGIYAAWRNTALKQLDRTTRKQLLTPTNATSNGVKGVFLLFLALVLGSTGWLTASGNVAPSDLASILLAIPLLAACALIVMMLRSPKVTSQERTHILAYLPIFAASTAFWAIMNQTYGVLAVYSDVRLDRSIGGFEVPAAWTQALNPTFIVLLSLPLAWLWARLGERGPSAATKMSIGVMLAGAGLWVLIPFAGGQAHSTPFLALAASVLVTALGELCCGPIGMAATAAHAPAAFRTQFSALFFLSMAAGTALAGRISPWYHPDQPQAEVRYFALCGIAAVFVGTCTLFTHRRLRSKAGH